MAATNIATTQIFESHSNTITTDNNNGVRREEIEAAFDKAVELRALHAALVRTSSLRFTPTSPLSNRTSQFSAQDNPLFTPGYEDEPVPGHQYIRMENRNIPESWDEYDLGGGNGDRTILSDFDKQNTYSRKGLPSELRNLEPHECPVGEQKSAIGSPANHITVLPASPGTDFYKSRRHSLGDFRSFSSCSNYKPAITSTDADSGTNNGKYSNIIVPLTDSHTSVKLQPKTRGLNFSWLFPRLKKKHKNENSRNQAESENVLQIFQKFGIMSIETLKRELMEANERRDAALMEVAEMKSSLGELKQKLENLGTYCEELKQDLGQAVKGKDSQVPEKLGNIPKRGTSTDGNGGNLMPVSEEVMVEGFMQIVSEARLSVKQFCRTLVGQIETDNRLKDNFNLLLQPYKLSLNSKFSKVVLYHLEAIINQSLYQDFENCVFQKNGSQKILDPQQDRHAQFSSFVALRNLSWNEVLRKGTKYYSEEFSNFCDQKMICIIATLSWTRVWPEQLLQAFFVAAKCIWLLHLLAFSFNPPLGILRVEENRSFDPHYMEDMFMNRQRSQGPSRVKIMLMPGFYVQERVLKCKVLCRYKSAA